MKKAVMIGISAGIAGYKALDLMKLLKKDGVDIFVIMTKNATKMFDIKDFEKASGHKVYHQLFEKDFDYREVLKNRKVDHIELTDKADLMVILPATANVITKLAYGLADDYLTTTALATTKPILLCPSMNVNMWQNLIIQENVKRLKKFGFQIIGPATGMLACGYEGQGRLANINEIYNEIKKQLNRTDSLKGKKILITAGGTTEKIDDIRYITNRSSGKMGASIAEECYLRGAKVLLLRAKNAVKPRYLIKEQLFNTAEELFKLIKDNIKDYDIIFHVAAVSDFKILNQYAGKISSSSPKVLELTPQIKILDQIKKLNQNIKLIAFKAEYGLPEQELINVSYARLKEAQADAIIANDVSKSDRGFEADTNEVYIISKDKKSHHIALSDKRNIAKQILDYLEKSFGLG